MLWRMITDKYDAQKGDRGLAAGSITTHYGCELWRSIRKEQEMFNDSVTCKVGNECIISFWR